MTKEEMLECKYVNDNMKFYTYHDFWECAYYIKRNYDKLKFKTFYKWYVYANIHITLEQKDEIWNFLNGSIQLVEGCNDR